MIVALNSLAICIAAEPTPLPPPMTRTESPVLILALVTNICQAVRNVRGNAAAS